MSYGFKTLTNNNGQVLVSEDTKNLHFTNQKLNPVAIKRKSGLGNRSTLYTYIYNGPGIPTPFFSLPTAGSIGGITRITNTSTNVWEIELIFAGSEYADSPQVYIFCEPQYISTTETYGLKVLNKDNVTPSFDSRLSPLVISATATITHSTKPCSAPKYKLSAYNCESGINAAEGNLEPNSAIKYAITGTMPLKPLFLYYSVAQAQQQETYTVVERKSDLIQTRTHTFVSTYWAFYRGAIGATSLTNPPPSIIADWAVGSSNCYSTKDSSYSTFGGLIDSGNKFNAQGAWPYSNETINPQSILVSIAPGEFYD